MAISNHSAGGGFVTVGGGLLGDQDQGKKESDKSEKGTNKF